MTCQTCSKVLTTSYLNMFIVSFRRETDIPLVCAHIKCIKFRKKYDAFMCQIRTELSPSHRGEAISQGRNLELKTNTSSPRALFIFEFLFPALRRAGICINNTDNLCFHEENKCIFLTSTGTINFAINSF